MSKFTKKEDELATDLDRWLFILRNMSNLDKIPAYLKKPIFERLFNIAEYSHFTKEEKKMYDVSEKRRWDNHNAIETAREDAFEEGIEKGSKSKALEIAKSLKTLNIELDKIVESTGLSMEEVKGI